MKLNEIIPGNNTSIEMYQVKIDANTVVTFGYDDNQSVFSEVYVGENYVLGSTKRSYSRIYRKPTIKELLTFIPSKYYKYVRAMYDYAFDGLGSTIK